MNDQRYLVLDFETRSEANLKALGAHDYAAHPSTRVLCAAWKVGTREMLPIAKTESYLRSRSGDPRDKLNLLLKNPSIKIIAHNAAFERYILKHVWRIDVPIERFVCTAAMSAAHALPRSLDGACSALKLKFQKNPEGKKLVNKYCKPRKPTKYNPDKWFEDPEGLAKLTAYCASDVDATAGLFLALPELSPTERKLWELDQRMNTRGLNVDRPLVEKILKMIGEETAKLTAETQEITFGVLDSTTQVEQMLKWLDGQGVPLMDAKAKTIGDLLKSGLIDTDSRRILEIRQAVSKVSTKKYHAFKTRSAFDGRVRDLLVYHGASTGRFAGQGLQPHNFPRGTVKVTPSLTGVLQTGDLELVRLIYGDPMNVFSSALRGMIVADSGEEFLCGDYAAIEARVLFWLARHESGLKAYREDRDQYRELATKIYNVKLADVTTAQREVAKRGILGCGYGMGWKKFMETCEQFGQPITPELAKLVVKTYRETHYPVPALWRSIEKAAIHAVQNPGKQITINRTTWFVKNNFLYCRLPNGRCLAYYGPTVKSAETKWGELKATLYHWGVNPKTRKWENAPTYGGKLVENVVQAVARDVMCDAMLALENKKYRVVITVHDELLTGRKKGQGSLEEFKAVTAQGSAWNAGLPIKVDAWQGDRYRK